MNRERRRNIKDVDPDLVDEVPTEPTLREKREDTSGGVGEYTESHPAFGVVQISRGQGGDSTFFDSSIKHHESIRLVIAHATRQRGLHRDWIHSTEEIVEVAMSTEQFAAMITQLNVGDGTPCTLTSIEGKRVPRLTYVNPNTAFREEFNEKARTVGDDLNLVVAHLEMQLKQPRLSVMAVRGILQELKMIRQQIQANMPFVATQFAEHMEHVVTEAKAEVEAFVTNAVQRAGLEAMQEKINLLPEAENKMTSDDDA